MSTRYDKYGNPELSTKESERIIRNNIEVLVKSLRCHKDGYLSVAQQDKILSIVETLEIFSNEYFQD